MLTQSEINTKKVEAYEKILRELFFTDSFERVNDILIRIKDWGYFVKDDYYIEKDELDQALSILIGK